MISILLTQMNLIITDVSVMMLPTQGQTYLGNSALLKTFMIWLLSSCSFFPSFAFASWLSWVAALSWPSRSRLSSDSTLRTNTDTSTAADKGREHSPQKLTLHFRCVVTGNSRHWSGTGAYFLSPRPSYLPLLLNTSLVRGGRMALTTFKRHKWKEILNKRQTISGPLMTIRR